MYFFHLNEFSVESEIAFPCETEIRSESPRDSLVIRRADLKDKLPLLHRVRPQRHYDVGDGVLINMGAILIWVALDGRCALVDAPDELLPQAALWMLNKCFAHCTLFRGGLPIHAAGAQHDGKFFGAIAPSGTGKSTLLWSLVQSGALFGNDDLIAAYAHEDGVLAFPSVALAPKVRTESLQNIGGEYIENAREALPESGEFWMPLEASQRVLRPAPLRALFWLQPFEFAQKVEVIRVHETEARLLLPLYIHGFSFWSTHFAPRADARLEKLAARVPFFIVRYPKRFDILPQVRREIQAQL